MSDIGHNSDRPRNEIIREIRDELDAVAEKKRALGEVTKTLKGRIKAELGMKIGDWDIMCRLVNLDDGDRSELGKVIREGFDALHPGQQSSFLDALDPKTAAAPAKAKKKTKAEQIAEVILEDSKTSEQIEADRQREEDEAAFAGGDAELENGGDEPDGD